MAQKMFHVTMKGVRPCDDHTGRCPYLQNNELGLSQTHFENPIEAQAAYEKGMMQRFNQFHPIAKKIVRKVVHHRNNTIMQRKYRLMHKATHNQVYYAARDIREAGRVLANHRRVVRMYGPPSQRQIVMQRARAAASRTTRRALVQLASRLVRVEKPIPETVIHSIRKTYWGPLPGEKKKKVLPRRAMI